MGERPALSAREGEVLAALRRHLREARRAPTNAEGAALLGFTSPRAWAYHVENLEAKGYVRRRDGARGLEIVGETAGFAVRVYGEVAAGSPIPAPGDGAYDLVDLETVFGAPDVFFLKVRGESMIEAQIAPGDLVALRAASTAEDRDKVVCAIDGEHTLKVFRVLRGVKWLLPCNPDAPRIRLDPDRENQIVGVLVGLVRLSP
jgi:repressor LexA